MEGFHRRHPGEGDGDCRVVAVGAMLGDNKYTGISWQESKEGNWVKYWNDSIRPLKLKYAGTVEYGVDTPFSDDPSMSVQRKMNEKVCGNADSCPATSAAVLDKLSIVVIVLDKYQPAPPIVKFTPTISTEAPHIIQEGQPITDRVTVGVKSGDQWSNGTSVTARGYYFTGSKDAILRNLPYTGDPTDAGINNYLNQIKAAGGECPWVAGMGARYGLNRAGSGPWVRDGGKNDSGVGRKRERRPAGRVRDRGEGEPPERRFAPLPIAGRTWACTRAGLLCGFFPLRGPGGLLPFPF